MYIGYIISNPTTQFDTRRVWGTFKQMVQT